MEKWALITGATAGIGRSTSELLAQNGWNLILTGRRQERLSHLKETLKADCNVQVETMCFDVSQRKSCEEAFQKSEKTLSQVTALINNAGLAAGVDPMDQSNLDDWEAMIDTNIKGLLYMTRLTLPFLKKNAPAHIINLGSVAGRWTYPGGGVYCSTKFAVRALSEGLRLDLNGQNIRVTNISPGLVETEFSEVRLKDKEKAKAVYEGMDPLTPNDIAECVLWSLLRPKHVNIQEMVVFPTAQASVGLVHRD